MSTTPLPLESYALLEDSECEARIAVARQSLGKRLVILGHHYQRDEVFHHADLTGDSLKLSQMAAAESERRGSPRGLFPAVVPATHEERPIAVVGRDLSARGMRIAGFSCITNMAAGVLPQALVHDEVMATANRVRGSFIALLEGTIERL